MSAVPAVSEQDPEPEHPGPISARETLWVIGPGGPATPLRVVATIVRVRSTPIRVTPDGAPRGSRGRGGPGAPGELRGGSAAINGQVRVLAGRAIRCSPGVSISVMTKVC
jgi:hypothetical protein